MPNWRETRNGVREHLSVSRNEARIYGATCNAVNMNVHIVSLVLGLQGEQPEALQARTTYVQDPKSFNSLHVVAVPLYTVTLWPELSVWSSS